ncbi:MAG: hypothetical protein QOF51_1842 [Chloroflexota bacterium]|jgi:GNAT superfamily N-acetyltransferase|nr:hypothetical protein [Chloroflexota bacterium]
MATDIFADAEFHSVTTERWDDLARFFAANGNPNYCWCMSWRLPAADFRRLRSAGRRDALADLVGMGTPVGILGYVGGEPIGWCSVAPRATYSRLERARSLPGATDEGAWTVLCFFVDRKLQGQRFSSGLLGAAVKYARGQGATVIEGYPVAPHTDEHGQPTPAHAYRYMGAVSTFLAAGFVDLGPISTGRRHMRLTTRTQ